MTINANSKSTHAVTVFVYVCNDCVTSVFNNATFLTLLFYFGNKVNLLLLAPFGCFVVTVEMEIANVPEQLPTAVYEENGSATVAADPVVYPRPPATEEQPTDLERLWKAVHDRPQDFTSWTDLLQYCEQENNVATSHEALEAFLARYPLCYGYWKKFADLERRAGNGSKAEEVPASIKYYI
uniref:Pre-mRNA-processing factor 39 n=1 Tax=Neogobius melanostomus TaxID=47308 RepID=A0A8C6U805_9GOBI